MDRQKLNKKTKQNYKELRELKRKGVFDMNERETYVVYEVHSDTDEQNLYEQFDNENQAIEYAKENATDENIMWVDEVEYDAKTDECVDYKEIWSSYEN